VLTVAERYDGRYDVFALQDKSTKDRNDPESSTQLSDAGMVPRAQKVSKRMTICLRGRILLPSLRGNAKRTAMFERAIELDPIRGRRLAG